MRKVKTDVIISPSDIIVTTPKSEMENSAREAEDCIKTGFGTYFRYFPQKPKLIKVPFFLFYVEADYIRGFALVANFVRTSSIKCHYRDREWLKGWYALMWANTWKWINPIPMKGFQGFRYFCQALPDIKKVEIIGGWKDPKPYVTWSQKWEK